MTRKEFSELLVECRSEADLSMNEVMRRTGWGVNQVQTIESASAAYNTNNVFKYLEAIGCSLYIINQETKTRLLILNMGTFNSTFKEDRKKIKKSQKEMGKYLDISFGTVKDLESNKDKGFSIDTLLKCIYGLGYEIQIIKK